MLSRILYNKKCCKFTGVTVSINLIAMISMKLNLPVINFIHVPEFCLLTHHHVRRSKEKDRKKKKKNALKDRKKKKKNALILFSYGSSFPDLLGEKPQRTRI